MRLSRADAAVVTDWLGGRYYFCSQACSRSFEADPGQYLERSGEHADRRTVRIPLVGLTCAAGDRLPLERGLSAVAGVIEAFVNPVDEAAYLTVDPGQFQMREAVVEIERFGARAIVDRAGGASDATDDGAPAE